MNSNSKGGACSVQSFARGTNVAEEEILDIEKLPNWVVRALKPSANKDLERFPYQESERSPSPLSSITDSQDIFSFETPEDFNEVSSPLNSVQGHANGTTTNINNNDFNNHQHCRQSPSAVRPFPKKTAYLRPWSELSLPVYPSFNMNFSAQQPPNDVFNSQCGHPPYRNDINSSPLNYIRSKGNYYNNFIGDAVNNNSRSSSNNINNNAYYHNVGDRSMEMFYPPNRSPPMNVYLQTPHLSGYNGGPPSSVYFPSDYLCVPGDDGLMYSQSRPLMSTHPPPRHGRMFHSRYQASHQFPSAYHAPMPHVPMTNCHIPISAQHPQSRDFHQTSVLRKTTATDSRQFSSSSMFASQSYDPSDDAQRLNQKSSTIKSIPDSTCLPSPLQSGVPLQTSLSTDSSNQILVDKTSPAQTSDQQDEAKSNLKVKEPEAESKNSKDPPICETGKPNPTGSPTFSSHREPHKPETPKTETPVMNQEKNERSPVAYTILFSSKEEISKPPELSDRRFISRAKSQDRNPTTNKLSEVKKPSQNNISRASASKPKTEKVISEKREKPARRSRANVKSTSSENQQASGAQMLSQSFNDSYLRTTHGVKNDVQRLTQSKIRPAVKKAGKDAGNGSISGEEGDCDAISESGTYVIDSEHSPPKGCREDLPHVFGIDPEGADNKKIHPQKSSGSLVDPHNQKHQVNAHTENPTSDKFPSNSSRRILPEAPEANDTPDKMTRRMRPTMSENYDNVSRWLTRSTLIASKPPPSASNTYPSTRLNFTDDLEKEITTNFHRSRRTERAPQNFASRATTSSTAAAAAAATTTTAAAAAAATTTTAAAAATTTATTHNFLGSRRDATPYREISGRRSVDPQPQRAAKVTRASKNSSLCDGDDANTPSQMSRSWISSGFEPSNTSSSSILVSRPIRPRSTSRPRMPKFSSTRKQNTPNVESMNDSRSGTDLDIPPPPSSLSRSKQTSVTDRLCAPTIATELKSKKILSAKEQATAFQNHPSQTHNSLEELSGLNSSRLKKRLARSKTLDPDECSSPDGGRTSQTKLFEVAGKKEVRDCLDDSSEEKNENGHHQVPSDMSQKVARLTEKFLRDTEELLKDAGASSCPNSGLEDMMTHLKDHPIADANILAAVNNLLKLQVHSKDKNTKVPAKKYKETTF